MLVVGGGVARGGIGGVGASAMPEGTASATSLPRSIRADLEWDRGDGEEEMVAVGQRWGLR